MLHGTTTVFAGAAPARAARARFGCLMAMLMVLFALFSGPAMAQMSQPRTVNFPSADGKTTLVGYLVAPDGRPKVAPAVVLMHGRSGVYSPLAKGNYSSVTLSKDIRGWAELWTQQGYWALVVDSFGPRGYPAGLPVGGEAARAGETAVRSFDAYGALRYLRSSPRVLSDRVGLLGFASGGSSVLAAMNTPFLPAAERQGGHGFRAAIALYPSCGPETRLKPPYEPYAPLRLFIGGRDDDGAAASCQKLALAGKAAGADMAVTVFEAANFDFGDPGRERQGAATNAASTAQTRQQAVALFTALLGH